MKLNCIRNINTYNQNSHKNSNVAFTSMPNGPTCTTIFRPNSQWQPLTSFTINHFKRSLADEKIIKVLSHFCADCSELHTYILSLIKDLGYQTVKKNFRFEARDFDHQMVNNIKNKEIMVIKKTADNSETDIDRLRKHLGEEIEINGKNIKVEDIFMPIEEVIEDTSSKFFGFQKCKVNDDLANLIQVKQENIKDFSDNDFNIIFVKNNLSCLGENALDKEFKGLVENLHEKTTQNGMVVVSKYDANKFNIGDKFKNIFSNSYEDLKGDVIYLK